MCLGKQGSQAEWQDAGNHFSLVAFCVLGDWYEQRKAHRMSGVLSPLSRAPVSSSSYTVFSTMMD